MSTQPDLLEHALAGEIFESYPVAPPAAGPDLLPWSTERFAEEQIRSLVRQVFLPGWARPARQVVFCAVDQGNVGEICLRVAQVLAAQIPGSVALVDGPSSSEPGHEESPPVTAELHSAGFAPLRHSAQRIAGHLWRVSRGTFVGENEAGLSTEWLPGRLRELKLEFDYTVLHGPPAAFSSDAALLGHLSDGVVLVLEANVTRRAAAQRTVQMLQASRARLLGAVLDQREFPIPEGIYRRL